MSDLGLKKWIPKELKRPIKDALLRRRLNNAINELGRLKTGELPSRALLALLIEGWSNDGYVANIDYLEEVAGRTIEARGSILECGSGVTTVLMGILCAKLKTEVWSLENSAEWQNRIMTVLQSHGISAPQVCYSPLVEYGEFDWYDPPLTRLPDKFSLVICDGPPGATKGGRYGLLPIMRKRIHAGTTILLDDAGRPRETELIKRWESEATFDTKIIQRDDHVFAVMQLI
jgi:hypothetical protein